VARTITSAYRFLPKQIREIDERDGGRFLQRFLAGVDAVWSDFDGRAREMLVGALIPALLRRAPADTLRGRLYDQMLRHLLWLLGFTTDLAAVTRELTDDDYARLVQIAVPLWKENATEQGIVSTVRLFTGRPVKLLDWFDLRSIVGVTGLWEKQRGTDPWVMGGQFGEYDERLMHLRIMDWPGLNKAAILALLEATHACGERLEVIFPAFLDDFSFGKMLWTSQGAREHGHRPRARDRRRARVRDRGRLRRLDQLHARGPRDAEQRRAGEGAVPVQREQPGHLLQRGDLARHEDDRAKARERRADRDDDRDLGGDPLARRRHPVQAADRRAE
jgi:hypothetical protein